ncbi:MAG: RDD family protein [Luteibacter sp.]
MLDTVRQIETPEGVSLRLHAAGPTVRAHAWLIDFALRAFASVILFGVLATLGKAGAGIGMLVIFAAYWIYGVVCEVWMNGQTVGKRMMALRVVNADGTPVTLLPSVIRNLLRTVDGLPGIYGVGLACCLMDPHGRRIGDIVAGTMVVHVLRRGAMGHVPEETPEPLPMPLRLDEQEALVAFAERARHLHEARRRELGDILEPLTGRMGNAGLQKLLAHANWLLGRT